MKRLKKVVFDIDGVLVDNIKCICEHYGIDYNKIKRYNIDECDELTEKEQQTIIKEFGNAKLFARAELAKGIELLEELVPRCDLYIDSLSVNQAIMDTKSVILKREVPSLKEENIKLSLWVKNQPKDFYNRDIIVEDCFEHLIAEYSKFEKAYLIRQPYNEWESLSGYPKIVMVDTVEDAIHQMLEYDL